MFYIIIVFISLYIYSNIKDVSKNKNQKKSSIKGLIVLLLAFVSLISLLLPWLAIPIKGGITLLEISDFLWNSERSSNSNDVVYLFLAIALINGILIVGGAAQMLWSISKKSWRTNLLEVIFSLVLVIIGFAFIQYVEETKEFYNTFPDESPKFKFLTSLVTVDIGPYFLIFVGFVQIIAVLISSGITIQEKEPILAKKNTIDELKKAQQLLNENLITIEEFDIIKKQLFE